MYDIPLAAEYTCITVSRARLPSKRNLSHDEREVLRQLHEYTDIVVVPADKGNVTVILETEDYLKKKKLLLNEDSYQSYKGTLQQALCGKRWRSSAPPTCQEN